MRLDLEVAQNQLLLLFEQHFYVFGDPFEKGDLPSIQDEYIKTKMDFSGDINGQFVLLFPEDKSKEVISNFLGLEVNDSQINLLSHFDAVSEIMNILGAHILSLWLDNNGQFKIGLPETSQFNTSEKIEFLNIANTTGILIDGVPIFLKIEIR